MDKILVEVFVPIIGKSFDMFIPLKARMYDILELIKKAVTEMSDELYVANETTAICNRADGTIININLSVFELGLHNGSKLMLI